MPSGGQWFRAESPTRLTTLPVKESWCASQTEWNGPMKIAHLAYGRHSQHLVSPADNLFIKFSTISPIIDLWANRRHRHGHVRLC